MAGGESTRPPLRVALLIDTMLQPLWVHRVVSRLRDSPYARLVLVVHNASAPPEPASIVQRWRERRPYLLYSLYRRLDRLVYGADVDPLELADMTPLVEGCASVEVRPRQTRFSDYFEDADLQRLRHERLDVALRLGFRILKGGILSLPRYGVWSFHHGDNTRKRGGPACFWEVMEQEPETGTILQVLTEDLDDGRVLYRSWSGTDRESLQRNIRGVYWKSAAFVDRVLREVYEEGEARVQRAQRETFAVYDRPLYTVPTNRRMAPLLATQVVRSLSRWLHRRLRDKQWFLAYTRGSAPAGAADDVPATSLHRLSFLTPPPDRFWADPFPLYRDGRHYIFFEELLHRRGKGHIACVELGADGTPAGPPSTVLEEPHHLSYPFLLQHEGELYMIPEGAHSRTVTAYRCVEFPHRWEPCATLLEGMRAYDATVFEHGGRWWMFAGIPEEHASASEELHLFHAPSPFGPWEAHRRNPVKSDVRGARPAGRVFTCGGSLYRPGQDSSVVYGYATIIHRITRIDLEDYEEEVVSRIDPAWAPGLVGTHTLNAAAGLTVLDGRRLAWRAPWSRRSS
jgi:hypothetical protein